MYSNSVVGGLYAHADNTHSDNSIRIAMGSTFYCLVYYLLPPSPTTWRNLRNEDLNRRLRFPPSST